MPNLATDAPFSPRHSNCWVITTCYRHFPSTCQTVEIGSGHCGRRPLGVTAGGSKFVTLMESGCSTRTTATIKVTRPKALSSGFGCKLYRIPTILTCSARGQSMKHAL